MRATAAYEAPSSLLYTVFVKPFYILRAIFLFAGPAFHTRPSKSKPIVLNFMRSLRADPATADSKIGVVGFCWGGQYAVLLGQDDSGPVSTESKPLTDAVFTAHPARFAIPEDVEKVKAPLSMALAEKDLCRCWGRTPFPILACLMIFSQDNMPFPQTTPFEYLLTPRLPQG